MGTPYAQRSTLGRHTNRNEGELMGSGGKGVQVASTPKDPKVGVGGSGVEKSKVGRGG
jgi:hypothetical protein